MNELPWWERWVSVLQRELDALDAAGIKWQRDDKAAAKGILRLELKLPSRLGGHELSVVYPDAYPYFRCQVYAKSLNLKLHQNPFQKNLCLIGRRTDLWYLDDTAAKLIEHQLNAVLRSAAATDPAEVEGLEEHQAEPFSDYYAYISESMLLVDSDWCIPDAYRQGQLIVGLPSRHPADLPNSVIRGAVLEVRGSDGKVLCKSSQEVRRLYPDGHVVGRWVKRDEPIKHEQPREFINELLKSSPGLRDVKPYRVHHVSPNKVWWLRLWGVVFPEQVEYRRDGQGWAFACLLDKKFPRSEKVRIRADDKTQRRIRLWKGLR